MRILEICTLTDSQIADLLGLMQELNPEIPVTPEMMRRTVGAPGTRLFAAEEAVEDGTRRIVGCATLCVYDSPTGRKASIEDVVVTAAYRGQGLGRALMQRIIDFAGSKLSPIDLRLTSSPWREEANALYLSLGFEKRDTNVYKLSL